MKIAAALPLAAGSAMGQTVLRVNAGAPPGGNGATWATAYNDLQAAIAAAAPIADGGGTVELWIAAGTYKPAPPGGDPAVSFSMHNGVAWLGGFAGDEAIAGQRNPVANVTVLNGDLGGDNDPAQINDNSVHVVTGSGVDATAVLDGVVVTGGAARFYSVPNARFGGGLVLVNSTPTVVACRFNGNLARSGSPVFGGAVYVAGASVTLTGCVFAQNSCTRTLGTVYVENTASLTVVDGVFADNTCGGDGSGAAVWAAGPLTLTGCTIVNCVGSNVGGIVANGGLTASACTISQCFSGIVGAIAASGSVTMTDCDLVANRGGSGAGVLQGSGAFTRCRFIGNTASTFGIGCVQGGGVFRECQFIGNSGPTSGISGQASLYNCLLIGNQSWPNRAVMSLGGAAAEIFNCTMVGNYSTPISYGGTAPLVLANSILYGNARYGAADEAAQYIISSPAGGSIRNCNIQFYSGAYGTLGNISTNPLFADLDGPDNVLGTYDDDARLLPGSPCIDAGDNAAVPSGVTTDLYGGDRILDDPSAPLPGGGGPATVDMGAAEYVPGSAGSLWVGGSGAFANAANWSPAMPDSTIDAVFNRDPAVPPLSVTFSGNASRRLVVGRGMVQFDLGGGSYSLSSALSPSAELGLWNDEPTSLWVNGGTLNAPSLFVRPPALLGGSGTVAGTVTNTGVVNPGAGAPGTIGTLSVAGVFHQGGVLSPTLTGAGEVAIDVAGPAAAQIDRLIVNGAAELSGLLRVNLAGGYVPAPQDLIDAQILSPTTRTGRFDVALLPGLADGRYFRVVYDGLRGPGAGVSLQLAPLPGGVGFSPPSQNLVNGNPTGVAVGDLNGDGLPDLAISVPDPSSPTGAPGSLVLLFNAGVGPSGWLGFSASQQINLAFGGSQCVQPSAVVIADLDGLPGLDVAVAGASSGNLLLLKNSGTGTFTLGAELSVPQPGGGLPPEPRALAAANMDRVNGTDLLVADASNDNVRLYVNQGGGGYAFILLPAPMPVGRRPVSIDPFDSDGDKDLDIAVVGQVGGTVSFIRNLSVPGGFTPSGTESFPVGAGPVQVVSGDLNGDGRIDLVTVNQEGGTVSVLVNAGNNVNGEPSFAPQVELPVGSGPTNLVRVDLDQDNDLDLAVLAVFDGTPQAVVLRNDTNGGQQLQFAPATSQPAGNQPLFLVSADVDTNGRADLVAVNGSDLRAPPPQAEVRVIPNNSSPPCPGDWDRNGLLQTADVATFITDWFASLQPPQTLHGDFDRNARVEAADVGAFVNAWFAAVTSGC